MLVAEAPKYEDHHEITMKLNINVKGKTLAIHHVCAAVMILFADKLKEHENLISEDGLPRLGVPWFQITP